MKNITALKFCAVLFLGSLITVNAQTCTVRQRKELRQLTKTERDAYFAAVLKLQEGSKPTTYDKYTNYHLTYQNQAHGTPLFFTWHRCFLREFEKALQTIDPSVMLPYWDWSIDSQSPETSVIFTSDYYGGNGGSGGCVQDGPFKSWKPSYPSQHCLQRQYDQGSTMSSFYGPEAVNDAIQTSSRYDDLRQTIESTFHGTVHVSIGGDMAVMQSPNDPIFYAHHAFVDKIWANWQAAFPNKANDYNGVNAANKQVSAQDVLAPWKTTVSQTFNTRDLCYTYDELKDTDIQQPTLPAPNATEVSPNTTTLANNTTTPISGPDNTNPDSTTANNTTDNSTTTNNTQVSNTTALPNNVTVEPIANGDNSTANSTVLTPTADDRQDLLKIRIPKPLPESWCKMNKLDIATVRQRETKHKTLYQRLNAIDGYVSPCALWNREDTLSKLIAKVPRFTAVIDGKKLVIGHNAPNALQAVANIKAKVSVVHGGADVATPVQAEPAVQKLIGPPVVKSNDAVSNVYGKTPRNVPASYIPKQRSTYTQKTSSKYNQQNLPTKYHRF